MGVQFTGMLMGGLAVSLTWLAGSGKDRGGLSYIVLSGIMIGSLFSALVSLLKFVKDLNLEELISLVVSCDDIKHPKPHPEMVTRILDATGYKPSETLVVGDAKYDIIMGKAAGCPTVGVTYGNGGRREMEEEKADYIIDNFAQLLDIVENGTPNT